MQEPIILQQGVRWVPGTAEVAFVFGDFLIISVEIYTVYLRDYSILGSI